MVQYSTESQLYSLPAGRWTPHRVRLAGIAAILGALALLTYITVSSIVQAQGTVPVWHEVGTLPYYAGEGSLILAWAGMFVGFAALRARTRDLDARLWRVGVTAAVIGTAMAALGFLVVTFGPAIGAAAVVTPGNLFIGIGMMVFVNVGALLMGISLFRTGAMSNALAALLVLVLPANLLAGPVGTALGVGPMVGLLAILPFIAAVLLLGNYLRTETPDAVTTTPSVDGSEA